MKFFAFALLGVLFSLSATGTAQLNIPIGTTAHGDVWGAGEACFEGMSSLAEASATAIACSDAANSCLALGGVVCGPCQKHACDDSNGPAAFCQYGSVTCYVSVTCCFFE